MPTTSSGATSTDEEVGPLQRPKRCERRPGIRDETCKQAAVVSGYRQSERSRTMVVKSENAQEECDARVTATRD